MSMVVTLQTRVCYVKVFGDWEEEVDGVPFADLKTGARNDAGGVLPPAKKTKKKKKNAIVKSKETSKRKGDVTMAKGMGTDKGNKKHKRSEGSEDEDTKVVQGPSFLKWYHDTRDKLTEKFGKQRKIATLHEQLHHACP